MGERIYIDAPTQCHIIAPYPAQCNRMINPALEDHTSVYFYQFLVLVFKDSKGA